MLSNRRHPGHVSPPRPRALRGGCRRDDLCSLTQATAPARATDLDAGWSVAEAAEPVENPRSEARYADRRPAGHLPKYSAQGAKTPRDCCAPGARAQPAAAHLPPDDRQIAARAGHTPRLNPAAGATAAARQ